MKRGQSIVWAEGDPGSAILCRSWLSAQWAMFGPRALLFGLCGRRMCHLWPVGHDEIPVREARRCERMMSR